MFTRVVRLTCSMGAAVGLLAGICLIAGVEGRAWRFLPRATVQSLFQLHDVLIIGQALLFIPFAAAFGRAAGMTASAVGVVSLLAMAILQTLRVFGIGPDTLYMLPQGVLGLWVIWMAIATRTQHARGTVGLGVASGIGLVLVGASLLTMLAYFGPGLFSGAVRNADATGQLINRWSHYMLRVGTYPGRLGFPLWAWLVTRGNTGWG
jgi:hypothetical protein